MEKRTNYKKWSIISGILLLLLLLVVFLLIPCPSPSQKFLFRILIALAAAGFSATIAGKIQFNNKIITAAGPIAIFAIIYFLNPAGWKDDNCDLRNMKATVYVDGKLTKDVQITIPDIGQKFATDEFGNVNIEFSNAQINFPTNIIFQYKQNVDTTVVIEKKFDAKMKFFLKADKKIKSEISGNTMNFLYNDININLSLYDPTQKIRSDEMMYDEGSDFVKYNFKQNKDTISIYPTSELLDEIRNNKIINGRNTYEGGIVDYFNVYFPQFDIKITNNSPDAIFFDQIDVKVQKSDPDNAPILVPSRQEQFTLSNIGWGKAKNLKIQFSTIPGGEKPNWNAPFETTISSPELEAGGSLDLDQTLIKNLTMKNVDKRFFAKNQIKYAEFYEDAMVLKKATTKTPKFVDKGANVFGKINYLDQNNKPQQIRFSTLVDVFREGYGAGFEFTAKYNAELKSLGKNYELRIPVSNAVKPKDFDRISLLLAAPQSSFHTFKIVFTYNGKTIELPYVFKLDLFNNYGNRENMKKVNL